jgi:transcription initiation factor TFIID subunit TAF12
MDMLAEPTAADTSSVAVHVKQNRLPHPSTMRIGTTSQNVAQQRYQQQQQQQQHQQQQQQHHHQQQLLQDRRRHESMGYCNAAMKQISPVDDVITLIQVDLPLAI